jgi:uncharacterized cupredoxin-like copper-binding protein
VKQFALALGAVALLAGCGGDDGATTSPAPQPSSSQVSRLTAVETEFAVKPDKTKVPLGRIVFKGVNEGKVPHILEVEGPGLENETAEIPPGESQTLELTLRTAGSYEIYCPIGDHKKRGMVAKLVVGD